MAAAADRWLAQLASLTESLCRASLEDGQACNAVMRACSAFKTAHAEREYLEQVEPRLDRQRTEEALAGTAKALQQLAGQLQAWLDSCDGRGGQLSRASQLLNCPAAKVFTAADDLAIAGAQLGADAQARLASLVGLWQAVAALHQGPGRRLLEAAAAAEDDVGSSQSGRSALDSLLVPPGHLAAGMIFSAVSVLRPLAQLDHSHADAVFEAAPTLAWVALASEVVLRQRQDKPNVHFDWGLVFIQYTMLLVFIETIDDATGSTAAESARRGPAGPQLTLEQRQQLLRMAHGAMRSALQRLQSAAAKASTAAGGTSGGDASSGASGSSGGEQSGGDAAQEELHAWALSRGVLETLTSCRVLEPALQQELRGPGASALLQLFTALLAAIPAERPPLSPPAAWASLQLLCAQLPATCLHLQLGMPSVDLEALQGQPGRQGQPGAAPAAQQPAGAPLQTPVGLWAMQQLPSMFARLRTVASADCLGDRQVLSTNLAARLHNISIITRALACPASGAAAADGPDQLAAWAAAAAAGLRMLPVAERLHTQWQRANGLPVLVRNAARQFGGAMRASWLFCASEAAALLERLAAADAAEAESSRSQLGALLLPLWQLHTAGCRLVHHCAGSPPAVLGASAAADLASGTSKAAEACCTLLRLQLQGKATSDVDAHVTERRLLGVAAAQREALRTLGPWLQRDTIDGLAGVLHELPAEQAQTLQALREAALARDPTDWAQEIENSWGLGVDMDGASPDELAEGAATRSCAWLACPALEGGGPAAGQGEGSRRCSACRAVWYCGEACSRADWRTGHKRACKHLAALREEAKRAAAAARRAAAAQQAPAARQQGQGAD